MGKETGASLIFRRRFKMGRFRASTNPDISSREIKNRDRSRRIAAEGMVLLENNGILPLNLQGRRIALYGNGARHTVQGGTGSGEVNTRMVSTVEKGLEKAGAKIMTKAWLDRYDMLADRAKYEYMEALKKKYADSPGMAFWGMFSYRDPLTIPTQEAELALSDDDTAIYVLARNSGEGSDRRNEPGDYQLHPDEENFLKLLASHYSHLIVVLNIGAVIDTSFLRNQPGVDALLLMGQAGSAGGEALADVLSGAVTPCGHLAATWAERYEDYPGALTFGHINGNIDDEYYTEGIYVGYRWFDSFGIKPAYPFGYGRSYTSFSAEPVDTSVSSSEITVAVRVTNTGKTYAGRELVQVYASAPEGELDKPYQELVGYAKTGLLQPGESQILTIRFPASRMASYDERSASWVLETGEYLIRAGVHSRSTKVVGVLTLKERIVCSTLSNILPLDCEMNCIYPDRRNYYRYAGENAEIASARRVYLDKTELQEFQKNETAFYQNKEVPASEYLTMDDLRSGRCSAGDLAMQLSVEELASLCVGVPREGPEGSSIIGAASTATPGAAGDTSAELLESRGVHQIVLADGPAGLRLCPSFTVDGQQKIIRQDPALGSAFRERLEQREEKPLPEDAVTYYQYCTAIPTATLLAQTWDLEAIQEAGEIVGSELSEFGITLWLAPGMNIQRNPLCGRNFEYYSEDPLVSGLCASADTLGVQSYPGVGTTIKHFACNNLEDNRAYNNSHVTERALREIYLRGFEIAISQAQPMSMMSSYNMINGIHTANSADLLTKVARREWGFAGIIMSDWGTTAEPMPDLNGRLPVYGCSGAAACIKAGNDLIMPGSKKDRDEIINSVGASEEDVPCPLTLEELRTCAARILQIIAKSNAYENSVSYNAFS